MGKPKSRIPYNDRPNSEKIQANWAKAKSLFLRNDYSAAIVRAATAAEIAANHYIRRDPEVRRRLPNKFVDHLLIWANGIDGQFRKLILPLVGVTHRDSPIRDLGQELRFLNEHRNSVVHSGYFKSRALAEKAIWAAHQIIVALAPEFTSTPDIEFLDGDKATHPSKIRSSERDR